MKIIDFSYFIADIYIPQVGEGASNTANNKTAVQQAIDLYETEIIDMALGIKIRKELYAVLDTEGNIIDGSDVKWDYLVNGHDYTVNGKDYFWKGLRTAQGVMKTSLVAYYVFYMYKKQGITQESGTGTVRTVAKNTKTASVLPSMINAWRKMFDWYGETDTITSPKITYKRGGVIVDYGGSDSSNVNLYQYMEHQADSFPNWEFTVIENKNQMQL